MLTLLSEEAGKREDFLEGKDFGKILVHLRDAAVRDFVSWGFWTGMRSGGIKALTWAMFDKETWTLRLPARYDKARKGVLLALEEELGEIIARRLAARRLDCPLIFPETARRSPQYGRHGRKPASKLACRTPLP